MAACSLSAKEANLPTGWSVESGSDVLLLIRQQLSTHDADLLNNGAVTERGAAKIVLTRE